MNARTIIEQTGIHEIHLSAKGTRDSNHTSNNQSASMGAQHSTQTPITDHALLTQVVEQIQQLNNKP